MRAVRSLRSPDTPTAARFARPQPQALCLVDMNLLPSDFDISFLIGDELIQVCIGLHQLQLRFENSSIEGDGKIEIQSDNRTKVLVNEEWQSTEGFENVIGQKVESWCRISDSCFSLNWDRARLFFYTEEGPYECFTIHCPNKEFYVL